MTTDFPTNPNRRLFFAEDFNDPPQRIVLAWHIERCIICSVDINRLPEPFGMPSSRYCEEYWEIINDYSEYDGKYAMRGNP